MKGRQARGTRFAQTLAECRLTVGLSLDGLAQRMLAHDFPLARYRSRASDSTADDMADDIAWLAAQLEALEAAEPHNCWPIAIAAPDVIVAVAECFDDISAVRILLLTALAQDEVDNLGFGIQIPDPRTSP
jgi:hypothetical protein